MITLPKFNPPKLPPGETLRRLRLQWQGLLTWPDDEDTRRMAAWLQAKIFETETEIKRQRAQRS